MDNSNVELKATGKVIVVNELQHISDTFQKQSFVIEIVEENPEYSQVVMFEVHKEKADEFFAQKGLKVGDEITVHFNLRGRKWNNPKTGEDRYFNTLVAWRFELENAGQAAPAPQGQVQQYSAPLNQAPQPAPVQYQQPVQPTYQQPQAQPNAQYQQPAAQPQSFGAPTAF